MRSVGLIGVVHSKNTIPIRLTKERWFHITTAHPEIESLESISILEIVESPDIILAGDMDELFAVKKLARKEIWIVVV